MATAKEWGTPGADRLRELFGRVESFTIGAEEEVLLVDPETFDLRPAGGELVSRLADPATYREELSAAQLEIVTPVCRSAGEVARSLAEGRRRAIEAAGGRPEACRRPAACAPPSPRSPGPSKGARCQLRRARVRQSSAARCGT